MHTYPPEYCTLFGLKSEVRFEVSDLVLPGLEHPDKTLLHLPSARYLEIHAACCIVAHMSGAAEYLDAVIRDAETISVLAEDGGSADALIRAMHLIKS